MNSASYSFMNIFQTEFISEGKKVKINQIKIPSFQRDYAQGRLSDDIKEIRNRFLTALYDAILGEPITLDFVYGDINDEGILTPLDGQQRLTTLFLLHWYAAKKKGLESDKYEFLKRFSYETRYSTVKFCEKLLDFSPSFENKISKEIIDQGWFPLSWLKDPTIKSMLVMLDAIDEKFKDESDIWSKLENNHITFYFLPIKDMGLTNELYIKMNSRGKPLTLFEHIKAELEIELRSLQKTTGDTVYEEIIRKIDKEWTDLLWIYRNGNLGNSNDYIIDDEFIRYFKFICDIICYKEGNSAQKEGSESKKYSDEFQLLKRYFSSSNEKSGENIKLLKEFFDCWCNITGYANPKKFLESFMSHEHESGKIKIFLNSNNIDIFEDCIHSYANKTGGKRKFPLNRLVLLYAIIVYLLNQKTTSPISRDEFIRRIRIVNNLIQNSENEIADRSDRNRIPAILEAVEHIIQTGNFKEDIGPNFNTNQIQEEKYKLERLQARPDLTEKVFKLEDHHLLQGQISILGLDNIENNVDLADRFCKLFEECTWDKIDCALMTIGNYSQQLKSIKYFQYGSSKSDSAWQELFHKSSNIGFDETKDILIKLLQKCTVFNDNELDGIIDTYINDCEAKNAYPWNYYYVKYQVCRPGSFGKLTNDAGKDKQYMYSVMQTKEKWSQNTYVPFFKEADEAHLSREHMGQRLVYADKYIVCENDSFIVRSNGDGSDVDKLVIAQNANGVDTEDRIIQLKKYIKANF